MSEYSETKTHFVILFPFGHNARCAISTLQDHGYKIVEFWDNFVATGLHHGIPITKPHIVNNQDIAVIICGNPRIQSELYTQAKQLCNLVYTLEEFLSDCSLSPKEQRENQLYLHEAQERLWRNQHPDALILKSIETPITEKCTLRCKDCANLMQYFQHPKEQDIDIALSDMDKVLSAVDHVEHVAIVGGEPFLHKEMYRYVKHFVEHKKVGAVQIYTNGTIIPSEENLCSLIDPKVYIKISNYGAISKHVSELAKLFEEKKIAYSVDNDLMWSDCAGIFPRNRNIEQLEEVFSHCCVNDLYTVRDGRMFTCPFLANAWALDALPLEISEYIKLDEYKTTEELREAILQFQRKTYFKGCDFCAGRDSLELNIPAAIQIKKSLPYKCYNKINQE